MKPLEGAEVSGSEVRGAGDVQEEGQFVIGLLSAHVTGERILVTMVTHVHGVHDDVFEGNVAVVALVGAGEDGARIGALFIRRRWRRRSHRVRAQRRRLAGPFEFEGLAQVRSLTQKTS